MQRMLINKEQSKGFLCSGVQRGMEGFSGEGT